MFYLIERAFTGILKYASCVAVAIGPLNGRHYGLHFLYIGDGITNGSPFCAPCS